MAMNMERQLSIRGSLVTIEEMEEFLKSARAAGATGRETVSIVKHSGDRPWDSGSYSISVNIRSGGNKHDWTC